jgi:hypothetical protein
MNLFYVHTYTKFGGGGDEIYVEMGEHYCVKFENH